MELLSSEDGRLELARGDQSARTAETTGNTNAGTFGGNASSLYSSVTPQLMQDVAHPTGFTPQQEANMTTAAEEGAGGGQAAAVGQGALLGARTKNAGASTAAIAEASRGAQRTLGQNTLGIKLASADLANQKRSQALSELGGLYGTSSGASNNALGEVASNSNANTNAANASWDWASKILDPALAAAGSSVKYTA